MPIYRGYVDILEKTGLGTTSKSFFAEFIEADNKKAAMKLLKDYVKREYRDFFKNRPKVPGRYGARFVYEIKKSK